MPRWELLDQKNYQEVWDAKILQFADRNMYQSRQWGEYKAKFGWLPRRYIAYERDQAVGMAQILFKRKAGVSIGWAPGGPLFLSRAFRERLVPQMLADLKMTLLKESGRLFVRFDSHTPNSAILSSLLFEELERPFFRLNSGYSVFIDLKPSLEELRASMTSRHRSHLKQAMKAGLTWKAGSEAADREGFLRLFNEMSALKADRKLSLSLNELNGLSEYFDGNLVVFGGYLGGELVSACVVVIEGKRANYSHAATGKKGREVSAAYSMVFELFGHLKSRGVELLDFGGIAPQNPHAAGVDGFKKGFGGEITEYLGEWEWASSKAVRYAMNPAIAWRSGL